MKHTNPELMLEPRSHLWKWKLRRKGDTYGLFVQKASRKCRLDQQADKTLSLFKLNGARVLDEKSESET